MIQTSSNYILTYFIFIQQFYKYMLKSAVSKHCTYCFQMVGIVRLELTTSCSQNKRATKLRNIPKSNGAPRKTRTPNLLVRSQTIYPVDLWAHLINVEVPTGFEPMMSELQSLALPTWLRNHAR